MSHIVAPGLSPSVLPTPGQGCRWPSGAPQDPARLPGSGFCPRLAQPPWREASATKQEAVGGRGQRGQTILSRQGRGGGREVEGSRHVIPACGSQGKGEPQAKGSRAPPPRPTQGLNCGGREGTLASHPHPLAPAQGLLLGPCPPPISGEKVRLCVLPDSCNESHIHSVLCAYWKASLCLLGSL